jgi:sulfonate transport system substrate-binding protein
MSSARPLSRPQPLSLASRPVLVVVALLTTLLVAACTPASSSTTSSGAAETFTLRVGATSVTGTPSGSLGWGDKTGILGDQLKAAGVKKIEYSYFQSGKDVVAALLGGALDVAVVGDNPTLTAKGNGADLRLLAFDQVHQDAWLIGAKNGPTTIAGLAGRSVTAPQGTIRDRAARQLIATAGLTGKIEVKDVPTPESIAGLSSGSVDATIVTGTGAADLADRGYPVLDKTMAHGLGAVGTTVALSSFVNAHPGFEAAWRSGLTATNADVRAHLDDYTTWVAQNDGVDVALVRQVTTADTFNTEALPADGVAELQAAYDFLAADGSLKKPFDLQQWVGQA